MNYLAYLLNLPWSLLGLCNAFFSIPVRIQIKKNALVFHSQCCGLVHFYAPKAKGVTLGNIIIVKKSAPQNITNHELIHIEQAMREPFLFQILYIVELLRKGYWKNKYEIEAYNRSNSWPPTNGPRND